MGWIIFAAYVFVGLLSGRAFYVMGFEDDYEDSVENHKYMTEKEKLKSAQGAGLISSAFSLVWPVAWIVLGFLMFVSRPTPTEVKQAQENRRKEFNARVETEMVRLRNWLLSESMKVPDTETLRKMAEENLSESTDERAK